MSTQSFSPVGKCIYCDSPSYEEGTSRPLGDEHIIARGLGGSLILPEASCRDCERKTSADENRVIERIFQASKPHLGLRGRRNVSGRSRLSVGLNDTSERLSLPLGEHPGTLVTLKFSPPSILLGQPKSESTEMTFRMGIRPVVPNFKERMNRIPAKSVSLIDKPIEAEPFVRMLAKIGHAYTTAKLGPSAFRPFVRDIAIGKITHGLEYYIGSEDGPDPDSTAPRPHMLALADAKLDDGSEFLICRIRLFGNYGTPTYQVIVGTRLAESASVIRSS